MLIPVARWACVPVVIGSQRNLGDLLRPGQRAALYAMFCLCTRVVCNSRAAARRLLNQGLPDSKIVVIPNGLPEEAFVESEPIFDQSFTGQRDGLFASMNHHFKIKTFFLESNSR